MFAPRPKLFCLIKGQSKIGLKSQFQQEPSKIESRGSTDHLETVFSESSSKIRSTGKIPFQTDTSWRKFWKVNLQIVSDYREIHSECQKHYRRQYTVELKQLMCPCALI